MWYIYIYMSQLNSHWVPLSPLWHIALLFNLKVGFTNGAIHFFAPNSKLLRTWRIWRRGSAIWASTVWGSATAQHLGRWGLGDGKTIGTHGIWGWKDVKSGLHGDIAEMDGIFVDLMMHSDFDPWNTGDFSLGISDLETMAHWAKLFSEPETVKLALAHDSRNFKTWWFPVQLLYYNRIRGILQRQTKSLDCERNHPLSRGVYISSKTPPF